MWGSVTPGSMPMLPGVRAPCYFAAMKTTLTILCAALAAVGSLHAATSTELLNELKVAASADLQALRKASKAPAQDEQIIGLSMALERLGNSGAEEGQAIFPLIPAVSQVQAKTSSEKVRALAKTLLAQINTEAATRQAQETARLEAIGKLSAGQWLAAKSARDLDAPIADVSKALNIAPRGTDGSIPPEQSALRQQLQVLLSLLQNRQDFFLKMEAGETREAVAILRQRSSSRDAASLPWIPRSVMIASLQRDQKLTQTDGEDSDAKLRAIGAKVLTTETAKELDPILVELNQWQTLAQSSSDGAEKQSAALIRSTLELARLWQDFLALRSVGNLEKARGVLTQMTGSGREFPGIPRSEILARAYGEEVANSVEKKPGGPAAPLASPEQILAKMKTLEDLDRLMPEFAAATKPDWSRWSEISNELQTIARSYRDLRTGNSARVSLGFSGGDNKEPIASLRAQLSVFALPRVLGASEQDQPRAGENALTYMRRLLASARERKDWPLASRILAAAQSTQVNDPLLKASDSTALTSFFSALNFEKARQFSLAVNSFQMALKTGSDLIPAEEIGEHLERIKREHEADYTAGLQLTLTPPVSQVDAYGRPIRDPRYPAGFPSAPYGPTAPVKEQPIVVPAVTEPAAKSPAPEPEPKKPQ